MSKYVLKMDPSTAEWVDLKSLPTSFAQDPRVGDYVQVKTHTDGVSRKLKITAVVHVKGESQAVNATDYVILEVR